MSGLYEYMKGKINEMYKEKTEEITIDKSNAFRLYSCLCYMLQIRNIIRFQSDLYLTVKEE